MVKPNILFIVLDTLRRDRLSAYGHTRETSPSFDHFAARATLFERAIAPAQWTVPAHASMFTGLYPGAHGLTQGYAQLSGLHPTLAEIMHGEGYHTVGFCNNPLVGVLNNGLQRGFDHFYNYCGAAVNRPIDSMRSPVRRALRRGWQRFARPTQNRFAQSDWLFRMSMNPVFVPLWTRAVNYKGHTENSVNDLTAYLRQHRAGGTDQPIFAFLNLMGTHLPYQPPQDYLDRVAPGTRYNKHAYQIVRRFNSEAFRWAAPTDPPLADWEYQALSDFYDAEIAYQDAQLGRLLDDLRTTGALDDTIVVITADHGESHGDHQFFGHSFVVFQELVHVPLLIHYPERFPAGKRVTTNVSTRRLFHTLLDLTDIKPPLDEATPNANVAGLSLVRSLNGVPDTEGGVVFSEAYPPSTFLSVIEHRTPALIDRLSLRQVRRGVYEGAHKLTMVHDRVEGLYNVANDPAETRDIAASHTDVVSSLQTKIDTFVKNSDEQRFDTAGIGEVDAAVLDNLRALGYVE